MKSLPSTALAIAIVIGATAIAPGTPADAVQRGKKKEEAKPAAPVISEAFRTAALAANNAANANDLATAETQLAAAQAATTNDQERHILEQIRLNIGERKKDEAMTSQALAYLAASPLTKPDVLPAYNYNLGVYAANAKQPAQAIAYFRKARELNFPEPMLPLRLGSALIDSGDLNGGVKEIEEAIRLTKAAGKPVPEDWYKFTFGKLQAAKQTAAANDWLRRWVRDYPTAANWRSALAIYMRNAPQGATAAAQRSGRLDVYRLMRATKALADENDYLNYAADAADLGLNHEVVAILDEGKAAGKIPASSRDATTMLGTVRPKATAAALTALEREAKADKDGRVAVLVGNNHLATGNPAKAAEFYRVALEKGGVDASQTNIRLAQALAESGDTAGARTLLGQLSGTPQAELAAFWLLYLDLKAGAPAAA